jgi:hypothetical protein
MRGFPFTAYVRTGKNSHTSVKLGVNVEKEGGGGYMRFLKSSCHLEKGGEGSQDLTGTQRTVSGRMLHAAVAGLHSDKKKNVQTIECNGVLPGIPIAPKFQAG